ncbi:MAG: GNAT family N-acetyltransferase [Rhodothermales bacterium]|nr:GNAT family N-acetyltransferase [Rhodothermales bacterium]
MHLHPIELDGSVDLAGAEPHPMLPDVVAATVALYSRKGFVRPWTGYVAVEAGQVVGTCGFAGPAVELEAEIAYFTFPGHEGKGVATRMAAALMALAAEAADSGGIRFVAHTLPAESPSTSILRKLEFVLLGSIQHPEDGEVWKWVAPGGRVVPF